MKDLLSNSEKSSIPVKVAENKDKKMLINPKRKT
jgi:hypothetical protein